jgi:hypothetical protein
MRQFEFVDSCNEYSKLLVNIWKINKMQNLENFSTAFPYCICGNVLNRCRTELWSIRLSYCFSVTFSCNLVRITITNSKRLTSLPHTFSCFLLVPPDESKGCARKQTWTNSFKILTYSQFVNSLLRRCNNLINNLVLQIFFCFFYPLLFASCTDTVKLLEAWRGVLSSTPPYK